VAVLVVEEWEAVVAEVVGMAEAGMEHMADRGTRV